MKQTHTHTYCMAIFVTHSPVFPLVLTCTARLESLRCWIESSRSWGPQTTKFCSSVRWPHSWQSWKTTLPIATSSTCVWMVRQLPQVFGCLCLFVLLLLLTLSILFFCFPASRPFSPFFIFTFQALQRRRTEECYWRHSTTQSQSTLFSCWAQELEVSASTCSLPTLWSFLTPTGTPIRWEHTFVIIFSLCMTSARPVLYIYCSSTQLLAIPSQFAPKLNHFKKPDVFASYVALIWVQSPQQWHLFNIYLLIHNQQK